MSREQQPIDETYSLGLAGRGVKAGLLAVGATAGLSALDWAYSRYFDSRKPNRFVDWTGGTRSPASHPSFNKSPNAVRNLLLEKNATQALAEHEIVKRIPGAVVFLGTDQEIYSRAMQQLGLKEGEAIDALCYQDTKGNWSKNIAVPGGFQRVTHYARGVIMAGKREQVFGAAIVPEEFGFGRMALGIETETPVGFIALQTHVAAVMNPEDFATLHPVTQIIRGDIGRAA